MAGLYTFLGQHASCLYRSKRWHECDIVPSNGYDQVVLSDVLTQHAIDVSSTALQLEHPMETYLEPTKQLNQEL
eukprot:4718176-Amphidinium_carterae.1